MLSPPICQSTLLRKLKLWVGALKKRETPPNGTLSQEVPTPLKTSIGINALGLLAELGFSTDLTGTGLPPEIAYGPDLLQACKAVLPGKQAPSAAKPAGVGVRLSEWKLATVAKISSSNPPKKNTLLLTMGPPMVKPPNSSLVR